MMNRLSILAKTCTIVFFTLMCSTVKTLACGQPHNGVTIIFHDMRDFGFFKSPFGFDVVDRNGAIHLVSFLEDTMEKTFTPHFTGPDTVSISLPKDIQFQEVLFNYKNIGTYYLYIKRGDTLDVSCNKDSEFVFKSSITPLLSKYYEFTECLGRKHIYAGIEPIEALWFYGPFLKRMENAKDSDMPAPILRIKKAYYIPIDSLRDMAHCYLSNYRGILKSYSDTSDVSNAEMTYYSYVYELKKNSLRISDYIIDNKSFNIDSLYKFVTLYSHSDFISYKKFVRYDFTNFLSKYLNIPLIHSKQATYWDWRIFYDRVSANKIIPYFPKKIILQQCLFGVAENFRSEDIIKIAGKYIKETHDTVSADKVLKRYNIDVLNPTSKDLSLEALDGSKTTLSDVMASHRGKIIYIDFCASWCSPCMSAMSQAKALRMRFSGKNIVFLYLSLDADPAAWDRAIKHYEISYLSECYRISNLKSSKFIDEYDVHLIPRYMIIDKNGNIFNAHALGPADSEIGNILNHLTR